MKKIKVTRRVHRKKPWYEKPEILFGVIIVGLGLAGLLLARFYQGPRQVAPLGTAAGADSAATRTNATPAAPVLDLGHVLATGAPLPSVAEGELLPPVRVETRAAATQTRRALRAARDLRPMGAVDGGPGSGSGGEFAFAEGRRLLQAMNAPGGGPAGLWDTVPLESEQRVWCDFEIQRVRGGEVYVVAFVPALVAEALGEAGSSLALSPAVPNEQAPWWQIWKRKKDQGEIGLHQGSRTVLWPDLSPEADCVVVLPLERMDLLELRPMQSGLARPAEVLEIVLH